ncbi:MAG: glycerol dehydratase reactivase beta/small subunit family protein, partial [Blautia sp.]|nr:glycerol dehydratase reactivase beta/small subunit family protein [Blautia sp.]
MIINRPAIMVYINEPDKRVLWEVCAGIEEEGVPYQVQHFSAGLRELAFQAAADSMLGTGIGIEGRGLAVQMQRLPKEKPVF